MRGGTEQSSSLRQPKFRFAPHPDPSAQQGESAVECSAGWRNIQDRGVAGAASVNLPGEMKQVMKNLMFVFLAIGLGFTARLHGTLSTGEAREVATASRAAGTVESLSATGEQQLRAIVASGRLVDLQWPNFSELAAPVQEFYKQAGYKLGWSQGGKPTAQALELIGILEDADQKGLDSRDYDGARWTDRLKALQDAPGATESLSVKFDVALTVSVIRYLSDLHLGKVDPKVLHKDFDPERQKHDPGAFLWQHLVGAPNEKEALVRVEPSYPGYQRTVVALQKYLLMAKEEKPDPLPQVKKAIAPGQDYEGTENLIRRLQFLGDLPVSASLPEGAQTYTGEVAEGVKRFQTRHGLEADGKLGPQTITELNRPMSDRLEQLRLTLERWRWVPHNFAEPPIVVNIPEFVLRTYDPERGPGLYMRVVVGRAMRTQTPVLEEEMKYVVFWPYWNVPPSILRGEIIPKITKDPGYIQKNNYEVVTNSGQLVTDGIVSEDVLSQLRAGKLMVRQKPGPKNALGLAKFIFPNDQNVYLHSTPSQSLFNRSRRDFSHGCIRVEDPKTLAEWVLRNNPGWTRERVEAAFQAQKEQQVNLARMIPVLIVYGTAIAKEDGQVFFFDDIYGNDKVLTKLFAQAYTSRN
jgi:murein L,D-transpeptidase YcbB/YkuD